jgi:hypothetical protein
LIKLVLNLRGFKKDVPTPGLAFTCGAGAAMEMAAKYRAKTALMNMIMVVAVDQRGRDVLKSAGKAKLVRQGRNETLLYTPETTAELSKRRVLRLCPPHGNTLYFRRTFGVPFVCQSKI